MATLLYAPGAVSVGGADPGVVLQTAQGGNADSTNIADRGFLTGGGGCLIASVAGTTVTVNLQGSLDAVNWFNVPYALVATPRTFVVSAITITTTTSVLYILQELIPWRFFKTVMSANTGMTLTSTFWSR